MHRLWKFRIRHIKEAIDKIQSYVSGMSFEEFECDSRTIDAVARNFQVIGEASTRVPDSIREKYPLIPWRKMRGMRNFVVHEYDKLLNRVVWDTLQFDLPRAVPLLQEILDNESDEE